MNHKKGNRSRKAISLLLVSGILLGMPAARSEAAAITSNASDKTAAVFHAHTAYCAGDYVIYEDELYICARDTQGAWDSTAKNFMQVTKNHELGKSSDLSADYDESDDPSEETSLMAFVANVWQKLKVYLGTEKSAAETDKEHYADASVSEKLNFLKKQNEDLEGNLTKLQKNVTDSFQSVSDGKSLLANTIAGRGVQVRPEASFQQLSDAVVNMAQLQYDNGHTAGHAQGVEAGIQEADKRVNRNSASYTAGVQDADGRVNENSASYTAGIQKADKQVNKNSASYTAGIQEADGRVNTSSASYTAGIQEADGRVNTNSESYKQGLKDKSCKTYELDVRLNYYGPQEEELGELFSSWSDSVSEHWRFQKKFTGNTILGAYATASSNTGYGNAYGTESVLNVNGEFHLINTNYGDHTNGGVIDVTQDTFTWDGFQFLDSTKNSAYTDITIKIIYI